MLARDGTPRIFNVCEHAGWATEHIVFQHDTFIDRNIILNFDPVTDHSIGADSHILSYIHLDADLRILQNVGKMADFGSRPNCTIRVYHRNRYR